MDWAGWIVFGGLATALLTTLMVGAQLGGLSRMDIPLMLGAAFTPSPDRARVVGFFLHLGAGQIFALGYALFFTQLGRSGWVLGGMLGVLHGIVALTVIVPLLPGLHPRMASERSGPGIDAALEPPGLFALNYGRATPAVALVAHAAFGAILGATLTPR